MKVELNQGGFEQAKAPFTTTLTATLTTTFTTTSEQTAYLANRNNALSLPWWYFLRATRMKLELTQGCFKQAKAPFTTTSEQTAYLANQRPPAAYLR